MVAAEVSMAMRTDAVRVAMRHRFPVLAMAALLGVTCANQPPPDDLDYLAWEVCRQVRIEGMTADEVSGILVDATRHGAVMDRIEAECGDEIAAVYQDNG